MYLSDRTGSCHDRRRTADRGCSRTEVYEGEGIFQDDDLPPVRNRSGCVRAGIQGTVKRRPRPDQLCDRDGRRQGDQLVLRRVAGEIRGYHLHYLEVARLQYDHSSGGYPVHTWRTDGGGRH